MNRIYDVLWNTYLCSERYIKLERSELYFEIQAYLQQFLSEEGYIEYEEKLNELLILTAQQAFLAGCEAVKGRREFFL